MTSLKVRCVAIKRNGEQCKAWAIRGATVCKTHGGSTRHIRVNAAVRAEVHDWGLGDTKVDPGEVLLRLVSQSAARVQLYSRLLEEAYQAAERLAQEQPSELDGEMIPASGHASEDLQRIFNTGGVGALIGLTWGAAKDVGVYATGEAIRGLADLEAKERERCAGFATKAVAAGLAERTVKIAEQQGEMLAIVIRAVLTDPRLGWDQEPGKRQIAEQIVGEQLLALTAG